jgi:uncharacterized protein YyaL (SSP411 family)
MGVQILAQRPGGANPIDWRRAAATAPPARILEEHAMSEAAAGARLNRLGGESSPYLLLHRHNPVDWYPWGPEALEKAKAEDKPIFLSVGYSTCYWCHVMERESFSDPGIAALMNREFINIKVDREERPDLDEIYMAATQILSEQGGWPNSVFLTTDLLPYYAGTYFPPEDRYGRPGFRAVLSSLADAWKTRRADVLAQAEEMAGAMRHYLEERAQPAARPPGPAVIDRAIDALAHRFDPEHGGFGGAPKFPTPANLFLLLERSTERPEAARLLAATLDAMARGGIYDQLGGGFHRYATDSAWKIPHFEKMLYDNGLLLEVYAHSYAQTGDAETARIVRETAAFLAREMTSPEGAFWSAIDAETHGHEGAFHVWTRAEIEAVLGEEDTVFLAPLLGFDGPPFFEGRHYVLHLPEPLARAAERRRRPPLELLAEVKALEEKLFDARFRRDHPATDDKILADWNGTAIAGLAVAGRALDEPELVARAARAADFVLTRMRPAGGTLLHTWRAGEGKVAAFLGDYAFLVRGLLALHRATEEERWLTAAVELTDEQIARLGDPRGGFYAAGESPDVLFRSKDLFDGALPAGNAIAVLNLLALAERTGEERFHRQALAALRAFAPLVERQPDAVRMLAVAAWCFHRDLGGTPVEGLEVDERLPEAGFQQLDGEAHRVVEAHAEIAPGEGGNRTVRLTLTIAPGWHLNANPAGAAFLVPTELAGHGLELRAVRYPPGKPVRLGYLPDELPVYQGTVTIEADVAGGAGGDVGGIGGHLALTYQPCDATRCLPPVTREVRLG